jgi:hypothetical protein
MGGLRLLGMHLQVRESSRSSSPLPQRTRLRRPTTIIARVLFHRRLHFSFMSNGRSESAPPIERSQMRFEVDMQPLCSAHSRHVSRLHHHASSDTSSSHLGGDTGVEDKGRGYLRPMRH